MDQRRKKPRAVRSRPEQGRRLVRFAFAAYGLAVATGILLGPVTIDADLWGDRIQPIEVLVPLLWLIGIVLSLIALSRGAPAAGAKGLAVGLLAPFVLWLGLVVILSLGL